MNPAFFDAESVHQSDDVAGQVVEAVGAGRNGAAAVATGVVAQNPEMRQQRVELRLPHGMVGGE